MITVFLMGIALFIFVVTFAMYWSSSKPNGILWFGVSLPAHALHNEELQRLQNLCRTMYKRYGALTLLMLLPMLLVHAYVSLAVIYLFLWAGLMMTLLRIPFVRTHRSFAELKRKNEWFVGEKRIMRMDTRLSNALHSKEAKLSLFWYLVPAFIALLPFGFNVSGDASYIVHAAGGTALGMTLLLFIITASFYRMKPRVYTVNSEINILLNQTARRRWSRLWLGIAWVVSCTAAITAYAETLNEGTAGLIWSLGMFSFSIVPILGVVCVHNSLKKLEAVALAGEQEILYTDDDEYWMNGTTYNNPNDRSIMVPKRIGIGTTINIGTQTGKYIYYGLFVFVAVVIIGTGWISVQAEFSTPVMKIGDSGTVKIQFPMYNYSFALEDVLELKLVDQLPEGGRRTNGIGTDKVAIGNFKLDDFGKSKLYLYKQSPPYIVIRLPDLYVVYNHKEASETRQIFAELQGR